MSDKAKPIIIAVGVGALGTLLAYLGYNAIVDNNKEANITEEIIGKSIGKTEENSLSYKSDNTDSEVKKTFFNKKDKKVNNSVFFDFWKQDKTKKEVEEELLNKKINKENENNDTNTENKKGTDYSKFYHY